MVYCGKGAPVPGWRPNAEPGLLRHQPDATGAIGADHYLMVVAVDGDLVRFHDPHGHPYATTPAGDFAAAWRADSIRYPHAPTRCRLPVTRRGG